MDERNDFAQKRADFTLDNFVDNSLVNYNLELLYIISYNVS